MHTCETSFRVRYEETDQMGVVYHSNYYIWFDIGRTEYIRYLGYSYNGLEEMGLFLPVLETHCVYKKAAKYDEYVTVKTTMTELKGVRLIFEYEVYNDKEELLAKGSTVQGITGRGLRPINIKKVFPDVYQKLIKDIGCSSIS